MRKRGEWMHKLRNFVVEPHYVNGLSPLLFFRFLFLFFPFKMGYNLKEYEKEFQVKWATLSAHCIIHHHHQDEVIVASNTRLLLSHHQTNCKLFDTGTATYFPFQFFPAPFQKKNVFRYGWTWAWTWKPIRSGKNNMDEVVESLWWWPYEERANVTEISIQKTNKKFILCGITYFGTYFFLF